MNVDCTSKSTRVMNHSNSVLPPLTNMSTTMVCDVVNQLLVIPVGQVIYCYKEH